MVPWYAASKKLQVGGRAPSSLPRRLMTDASELCASALACDAEIASRGANCSCAAVRSPTSPKVLVPLPNGDACAGGLRCAAGLGADNSLLRLAWARTAGFGDSTCFKMAVHQRQYGKDGAWMARGDYVSDDIRIRGTWEFKSVEQLERFSNVSLPARGTFVDIGAQIGYFSLNFARRGWSVLAIEPMPHNRRALRASLCVNPSLRSRLALLPYALVDKVLGQKRCIVRSGAHNRGNGAMRCGTGRQYQCKRTAPPATQTLCAE
eukprot:4979752-Prymnesium_polylepis.1